MKTIIKIAWLFPHVFCLHGERGNILAIEAECRRRAYLPQVDQISLDSSHFDPLAYDLIFCPPGEIKTFKTVIDFLKGHEQAFKRFIKERPLLVTGTSLALFGQEIIRFDQSQIRGLGLINIHSRENDQVYGDDLYYQCSYNGVAMEIFGNQIQMMQVDINGEQAFGRLSYGYGNNGKTQFEGIIRDQAIFTNTLGPILVCNPWLTIEMINLVEKNKNLAAFKEKRNNQLELKSLATKIDFIKNKETELVAVDQRR